MADPTAFYEPEEDELLSSLAVPQYGGEGGYDEESYHRLQELEQNAYAQQLAAAEQEQAQALEQVPEDVKRVR
jgi:translation initiation factor 3 subunit L